jgi:hypothetical protein
MAIRSIKENKSPGIDGIPIVFYQKFWNVLQEHYMSMIFERWELKMLPYSTKTSVLSLIHKGEAKDKLTNYRPLSLTNCDYKIIATVFAGRLQNVIQSIINPDQVAYIKDRYIGCSIRNLLDLYEYTEKLNIPGAFLCMDFEKAFDSVEHNFMFEVLKRFNFGQNFINWIKILYNDPFFKIKNNGWLSKSYPMKRGIRQGCPLSALLFLLVIEILAIMVRKSEDIKGIEIGNTVHKIVQYADDATICVTDLNSITASIKVINNFSKYAGPNLNVKKTKGIWLGSLKDLGLLIYENIKWTGNPIKCLGIYIGHNKDKCYNLNWSKKINQMAKCFDHWKCRKLTLSGKVHVIKTYALSKIVYIASVLVVPEGVKKRIKELVYTFLWGKRERIKRSTLTNDKLNGGLRMVNIDSYLESLKAAWVPRINTLVGKWSDIFHWQIKQLKLPREYIWKTSFKKVQSFPIINVLSPFYQEVILSFNRAKFIKPFNKLNKHEIFEQPIWGNEYFKVQNICLYYKGWMSENILYIKDLVNNNGVFKSDMDIYVSTKDKRNIYQELYVITNYVIKRVQHIDASIAPFVKIRQYPYIIHDNKVHVIHQQKSKLFYNILSSKETARGNMESLYSREFNFENTQNIWSNVYQQKLKDVQVNKLSNFNFKVLHNIVPCGYVLSKWQRGVQEKCEICNEIETMKHMLYNCASVNSIWQIVSYALKCNISWKNIVCGFPKYEITNKIVCLNIIISIVSYAIFKENSNCKFNNLSFKEVNLKLKVKYNLIFYQDIISGSKDNALLNTLIKMVIELLSD